MPRLPAVWAVAALVAAASAADLAALVFATIAGSVVPVKVLSEARAVLARVLARSAAVCATAALLMPRLAAVCAVGMAVAWAVLTPSAVVTRDVTAARSALSCDRPMAAALSTPVSW